MVAYKPRGTLPEERKPIVKTATPPKVEPKVVKPVKVKKPSSVKKPKTEVNTSFADFSKQFVEMSREKIVASGIKPEKIKELKYINKDICHIRFTDDTFRFFFVGETSRRSQQEVLDED